MASKPKSDNRPVVLILIGLCSAMPLRRAMLDAGLTASNSAAEVLTATRAPFYGARDKMPLQQWEAHKKERRMLAEAEDEPYISAAEEACFSDAFRVVCFVAEGAFPPAGKGFPVTANPERWKSVCDDLADNAERSGNLIRTLPRAYRA